MKFIVKNGNMSRLAIVALIIVGLVLVCACIYWIDSYMGRLAAFTIGLTCVAASGFAGRAKALGLRPFGESSWRHAKKTDNKDDTKSSV